MSEKELPEFQQEDVGETRKDEKNGQQDSMEKVKVCDKPAKSCSFVRNWGGWPIAGE
jgi:hypothetical protein